MNENPASNLPRPTSRSPVRRTDHAMAVSKALRFAARAMRDDGLASRGNVVVLNQRGGLLFGRAIRLSFLVLVLAPVLITTAYVCFIASRGYEATTQFTVRAGARPDPLGTLADLGGQSEIQNTRVIADYITSANMIRALSRTIDMKAVYSNRSIDPLSRVQSNAPIEKFEKYWNHQVNVKVDNLSNVVTVSVKAFTAADALRITQAVLRESEARVNEMADRARENSVKEAATSLAQAQTALQSNTRVLRSLRDKSGLLDPAATNQATSQTLGQLQAALSNLKVQYDSQSRWIQADAPQMQMLRRRIDNLQAQIRRIELQVASPSNAVKTTLAQSSSEFEKANVDMSVAEQNYVGAVAAYERSRAAAESQAMYVLPFEEPTLPEQALYPRRLLTILTVAGICGALWASVAGLAVIVRNNMAV